MLCLLMKQYIYSRRRFCKCSDFAEFNQLMFQQENLEKYIAAKNDCDPIS